MGKQALVTLFVEQLAFRLLREELGITGFENGYVQMLAVIKRTSPGLSASTCWHLRIFTNETNRV